MCSGNGDRSCRRWTPSLRSIIRSQRLTVSSVLDNSKSTDSTTSTANNGYVGDYDNCNGDDDDYTRNENDYNDDDNDKECTAVIKKIIMIMTKINKGKSKML